MIRLRRTAWTRATTSRASIPIIAPLSFATRIRGFHASRILGANFPFKLHDIGEGIAEVELVKWYVEVGQKVEEFDVLCEVQSDKSTVELTSPTVGVVKRLGAAEGVVLKVGEVVCDIETVSGESEEKAEVTNEPEPQEEKAAPSKPESTPKTEESKEDESLHQSRDDLLDTSGGAQFSGEAAMLPSPPPASTPSHSSVTPVSREERREKQPWSELRKIVKASPAVRTLAARMGIELVDVEGSGEGGRVLRDDLTSHSAPASHLSSGGSRAGEVMELESRDRGEIPEVTRVEFGRTRKVMYRAMGDMGSVPHFGYTHTLNLTPLLPYLKTNTATQKKPYQASDIPSSLSRNPIEEEGEKAGLLSFLVKGLLLALEVHPIMRSRVKFSGDEKWLEVGRDGIVGVAVSDPKYGLLTPSLPPLPSSTPLSSISSHLTKLRKNATKPSSPANITISSVGGLGEAKGAMPVLPPGGGVAICAVGRAAWSLEPRLRTKRVWDYSPEEVVSGGVEGVLRCSVGWSGDHRVLEGAELIAFTETWKMYIEEPWRWMKVD